MSSIPSIIKKIFAHQPSYKSRLKSELGFYKEIKEVHELPKIFHYWSNKYLAPAMQQFGFANPDDFFFKYISDACTDNPEQTLTVLSLGSGNCDLEARLASKLDAAGIRNFHFRCLDINPDMLARGKNHAIEMNVLHYMQFELGDFNRWEPEGKHIDVVLANQSLHHVQELEHLFCSIKRAIGDLGVFLVSDMIGRNGHQRWPEAMEAIKPFWKELPNEYKFNQLLKRHEPQYVNHDCSIEGFEGIRAQDILPPAGRTLQF